MSWELTYEGDAAVRCEFAEVPYKGRPRHTKSGRVYTPRKTHDFERTVREAWLERHGMRYAEHKGPVRVSVYCERPLTKSNPKYWAGRQDLMKPDADNRLKVVLDALNGIAWHDDSQVTHLSIEYRRRPPHGGPVVMDVYVNYLSERLEK